MKFKSTVIAASVLAGIMSLSAGAYAMAALPARMSTIRRPARLAPS